MGPWEHIQAGQGLPADGVPTLDHIELQWFDQYVKGMDVGADRQPDVTQYVLGYGHYVTATDWPNPQARAQRLYLHGDKSLSTAAPATAEAANTVAQLPIEGVCSISATQWTAGILGYLQLPCFTDDSVTEQLDAVYETPAMAADLYINGPIEADLWISTTAADASLSVRVDDVDAGGTVTPLSNGLQTASLAAVDPSRSRTLDGQMIQPWHPYTKLSEQSAGFGQIVKVPVEIFETSALIAKGHRLRVAVGTSDLPEGVPPLPTLLQGLAGALTVYSDSAHPSSVVIPVVPAAALGGH
jgi:putative CocE/NonD family hydrolase